MRAICLFAVLAFAPPNLFALVREKPDQDEIDQIQGNLDKAKELQNSETQKKIVKIEIQFGLRDDKGNRLMPPSPDSRLNTEAGRSIYQQELQNFEKRHKEAIRNLITSDEVEEYAAAVEAHKVEIKQADELRKQAVEDTALLFQLTRPGTTREIASGPPKTDDPNRIHGHLGDMAVWKPEYSESAPKNQWGHTDLDGKTAIAPVAFESVARLAFTLDHESRHFEDLTTPDRKDERWNEPGNEVRLRKETKDARAAIFGLSEKDIAQQDKDMWTLRKNAALWIIKKKVGRLDSYKLDDRRLFPGLGGVIPGHSSLGENLESIKKEALELEAKVEREAKARKEARERKERERIPEVDSGSLGSVNRAIELASVAVKACLYPDTIAGDDLAALSWFPQPKGLYTHVVDRAKMSSCQSGLFDLLLDLNANGSRLTVAWIKSNAVRLRDTPGTVPPRVNVFINLGFLAEAACKDPDALTPDQMSAYLAGFPDGERTNMSGPHDCVKDLYDELMGFNTTLQPGQTLRHAWLVEKARKLKADYAPSVPKPTPSPDPDDVGRRHSGPGYNHCIDPGQTCFHN